MESPVVHLSVSSHQGSDSDSSLDNCDEDETPESRDYTDSMHGVNVNVKKPKGFGRRTIIVSSLVLLLLAAVAVGMMLLLNFHLVVKHSVDLSATITPQKTRSTQESLSGSTPFVVTSSANVASSENVAATAMSSARVLTLSPFDACWNGDSDCPACPTGRSESFTSHIWLGFIHDIVESVNRSQHIMRSTDYKDVILYRPLFLLHTALNYFCCHTSEEKVKILEVLGNQTWTPLNITYDTPSCNLDHDGVTIYMLTLLSNSSQDYLFNFVRQIENSIKTQGIPVNKHRKQPFHVTLSLVNHSFPVRDVIDLLHRDIPVFGSVLFDHFYSEFHKFKPKGYFVNK